MTKTHLKQNILLNQFQSYFKKLFTFIAFALLLTSCGVPKNITYFEGLKDLEEISSKQNAITTYKPQDIISINVSAADPEAAVSFNTSSLSISSENDKSNTNSTKSSMYLIDSEGNIEFPVIGTLKIAGLSNVKVKELIKEKLTPFLKKPIVTVRLENFKVTILGEVNSPGPIKVNNEQITIIEALGLAGDLNIQGKRKNITVIRKGADNKRIAHKLDITSKDVFNSPAFYLAQNDVIYVEPNDSKKRASRVSDWPRILTSATSVLGIIISIIAITR